jgi:hypothetical protein
MPWRVVYADAPASWRSALRSTRGYWRTAYCVRPASAERQAALESLYGDAGMATGMATSTPSQTVTEGANVADLRSHRNKA